MRQDQIVELRKAHFKLKHVLIKIIVVNVNKVTIWSNNRNLFPGGKIIKNCICNESIGYDRAYPKRDKLYGKNLMLMFNYYLSSEPIEL